MCFLCGWGIVENAERLRFFMFPSNLSSNPSQPGAYSNGLPGGKWGLESVSVDRWPGPPRRFAGFTAADRAQHPARPHGIRSRARGRAAPARAPRTTADQCRNLRISATAGSKHSTDTHTRSLSRSAKKKAHFRGIESTRQPVRANSACLAVSAARRSDPPGSIRYSSARLIRSRTTNHRGSPVFSNGSGRPGRVLICR
jgi:hypothetical protein